MYAEVLSTVFAFGYEGDARRRRPGSRRSTSAWTVYAGADFAAPPGRSNLSIPSFQSASGDLPGARIQGTARAVHRSFPESTQLPGRPACRRNTFFPVSALHSTGASGMTAHKEHLSGSGEMIDLKEEKVS